jgi:hypothetical protein
MDELTPREFLKDFTNDTNGKILVGLLLILGTMLISWIVISTYKGQKQTDDFINREIAGILIKSEDIQHGITDFTVRQHTSREELTYHLSVSKFFRENNIQKGDSIVKKANSNTIMFFKRFEGKFKKCCDLYYYN